MNSRKQYVLSSCWVKCSDIHIRLSFLIVLCKSLIFWLIILFDLSVNSQEMCIKMSQYDYGF